VQIEEVSGAGTWRDLFRRAGYLRYFGAVALARTAGTMFNVGVVLLIVQRTGSLSLAGFTAAAGSLPAGVTGPFLGAWLDIARSRRALIAIDQLATVVSLTGLLVLTGHGPDWTIPLLGLLYGVTRPLSSGAFRSVLPEIVGSGLLPRASTMEATSVNLAYIVGPALAGLIAGAASPAVAVEAELALTVITIALIVSDRTFELRPQAHAGGIRRSVTDGFNALATIVPLRAATASALFGVTAWGSLSVGFPAYAIHLHAGAHASGYLWAAVSVGSVASAFAFARPALRIPTIVLTAGSPLAMGLSALLWPLASGLPAALALVTLTGLFEGPALGAFFTVEQRYAPAHLRAQVFSTIGSLTLVGMACGSAVAGPVHAALGTHATLLIFTVFELAAAGAMLTARKSLRGTSSHA
jgi:MFS family permease